jgi:hypothetical protein
MLCCQMCACLFGHPSLSCQNSQQSLIVITTCLHGRYTLLAAACCAVSGTCHVLCVVYMFMFCWCGFVCCTCVIIALPYKRICSLETLNPNMIKVAYRISLLFSIGEVSTAESWMRRTERSDWEFTYLLGCDNFLLWLFGNGHEDVRGSGLPVSR